MKQKNKNTHASFNLNHFMVSGIACLFFLYSADVFAQELPDPCPVPSVLAQESPPDMATVQADIDILSLCVERARLLDQLNTLVQQMSGSVPANIPASTQAPARGAASSASNQESTKLFDLPQTQEFPELQELLIPEDDIVDEKPKTPKVSWKIRKISGNQRDGIVAELRNKDGSIVRAQKGDTLSDGSFVKDVSVLGVVLSVQGTDKNLDWE